MKKLIITLATITLSSSSLAGSICPAVEFAELQTFTEEELGELFTSYRRKAMNMIGNHSAAVEEAHCMAQHDRIFRIYIAKVKARKAQVSTPAPQ